MALQTAPECLWTVTSDVAWIVPARTEGQGSATVSFSVTSNPTPYSRAGTLVLATTPLNVIQEGASCAFDVDPTRIEIGASGGDAEVRVATLSGCSWSARAGESWITIVRGASATGTGTVELSIALNNGRAREGSIVVGGETVAVAQQQAAASPSPSPAPPVPPTPPVPAPPPSPDVDDTVELNGPVRALAGLCPMVTFNVDGTSVWTDQATQYRKGNCRHLEGAQRVIVIGERQDDGRVRAERIDLEERD
ncbi:MAG: BACON domain-containing carbohydrate-binding protein, partial [Vicinamibacterales bacterium]